MHAFESSQLVTQKNRQLEKASVLLSKAPVVQDLEPFVKYPIFNETILPPSIATTILHIAGIFVDLIALMILMIRSCSDVERCNCDGW